jgi:hypothetical protein
VEVVEDDDEVEQLATQVGLARLQVGYASFERQEAARGLGAKPLDGGRIAIEGDDRQPALGQQQRVSASAAGHVEGAARGRNQIQVGEEPGRGGSVITHVPA